MRHIAEPRRRNHGFVLIVALRHTDGHRKSTLAERTPLTLHRFVDPPEQRNPLASKSPLYRGSFLRSLRGLQYHRHSSARWQERLLTGNLSRERERQELADLGS